jgi:hypothetical protein
MLTKICERSDAKSPDEAHEKEDGSWRKVHNDEFHRLYSSPNIARVIRSRRMR